MNERNKKQITGPNSSQVSPEVAEAIALIERYGYADMIGKRDNSHKSENRDRRLKPSTWFG
jgi:hypothetical protein